MGEMIKNKYLYLFFTNILFVFAFSGCKPYDFLWEATDMFAWCDAKSILFVEVESTEYKGPAWTDELRIHSFFIDYDSVYRKKFNNQKYDKCHKYICKIIKNNTIFPLKDSNNSFPYFFPLSKSDSTLYNLADQGIDTFINVVFHDGYCDSFPDIGVSKIMFDAGIYVKGYPLWIEDKRFITKKKNGKPYFSYTQRQRRNRIDNEKEWKSVIPSYYIRKGKNWYKNTWKKHQKKTIHFVKTATPIRHTN